MARINTSKFLSSDNYYSAIDKDNEFGQTAMVINPLITDQYDYAFTDDIVLLNERKDTSEKLYDIWINSPYYKIYQTQNKSENTDTISKTLPKIPKDDISKIFYYMKNKLQQVKNITTYELVIAINEFFNFDYNYVVKKVLSPKIKSEILEDYYNNGMKERMDNNIAEKLF